VSRHGAGDPEGMPEPARGPLGGLRPAPEPATDPLGMPLAAAPDPLAGGRLDEGGEIRARATCAVGVCDGSGWVIGEDDEARPCECRKRRIKRARSRGMQGTLPQRYRGVSFDRPPISDMARQRSTASVVAEVREYCDDIGEQLAEGNGVWLQGDVGTGKTSLAMLISKTALEAGFSVAIYSMPRLLARIRRTYDADSGEEGYLSFFDRLTSVDLLHIDDLGAEKRTDWVLEQLYAIVDRRYEEQRAMVVTTNMETPDLKEQIGERTVSRLLQICGHEKPLYGDDWRERVQLAPAPGPDDPS
jgi:DNA replication protein DnaC